MANEKIHLSSIDSTNTYLKNNYKEFDNYTFVSSDEQLAGRGRNNRQWKSENGKNLLFSLLILDKELFNHYKEISIISAYSIIEVLERYGINELSIKWPNDVYYQNKKIAGILLESIYKDSMECLIIGTGVNVNQRVFAGEYIIEPTSVSSILNKDVDLNAFKENIYQQFLVNLQKLKQGNDFYQGIKKYDYLAKEKAFVLLNNKKEEVEIIGINDDYSLSIINNNKITSIQAGEISFHL